MFESSGQSPLDEPPTQRLLSLDVFRGLVILSMLVVNNLGDFATTGYFWKHADWIAAPAGFESYRSLQGAAYADWWQQVKSAGDPIFTAFSQLPLWKHCTLADFVMPCFMFIMGVAIPFSIASAQRRGQSTAATWVRVVRRAAMLVALGWIMCYFRDQFGPWWRSRGTDAPVAFHVSLGMDVLQLLGVGYLLARILAELPVAPRIGAAAILLIWHWAVLRFWPQTDAPRGTFTGEHNAIGAIYSGGFWLWREFHLTSCLSMNWKGLLSVPPAAATMLLGTLVGQWIRRTDVPSCRRVKCLALAGLIAATLGFLWGFDLPFNKPRWSSSYLLYCCGVGSIVIAICYLIVDIHQVRGWTYALVVLGANSLAAYLLPIMGKVIFLNLPRIEQSNPGSLVAVKYCTLITTAAVILLTTFLLVRAAVRQLGVAAYGLWLPTAGLLIVICYQFIALPVAASAEPGRINLTSAIGIAFKNALGSWEGGWAFTVVFVLLWWLLFDVAHRRGWHWKL